MVISSKILFGTHGCTAGAPARPRRTPPFLPPPLLLRLSLPPAPPAPSPPPPPPTTTTMSSPPIAPDYSDVGGAADASSFSSSAEPSPHPPLPLRLTTMLLRSRRPPACTAGARRSVPNSRFLRASRLPLRLLLPQIPPLPLQKMQYITKALDHLSRIPSQSQQNPQFAHQASLASLLQKYGFPQSQLHEFLQKNRFLSSYTPSELENSIKVLLSFGFSQKILLSVLISSPRVLNLGFLEEWRLTLSELGLLTSSPSLIQKVLEHSGRFQIRPLFEEFKDLGFGRNEVREVLLENLELLLGMDVGELSRCMELIRSLKCRLPIKEKILSRGQLRAAIDVKLRVDFLCKYGLIRRDAFKVLYVEPRTILYKLQDVERKIDFLLHRMGFSIEHLVEFPEYLGANMEKQIIPRYKIIEHLRSRGGLGFEVGLKHLIRFSRQKFYNLFVKPYPECEDIYGRLAREVARGHRHPTGLWKMFKPEKFPESEEDVRNMKLFMKSLV